MDQYIGKMLDGRYEILEVIGTGGMAVVYKARCHRLNRLVAIKILREDLSRDSEFLRRFHDESQAVAMLSHPNIMAVYDVSKSSEVEYIVMELLDGITLKQYMSKKGEPLNWKESLHFITQMMKALSHAHSRGIVHRDIKPQNIMVLRDGSIKVADFGIARLASATQSTLTQVALGSVHYISPEQARGSRVDKRADIYSAGVVLYEMLTGTLPFDGESPVAVAIQHISSVAPPPSQRNPDIPEALESITLKAMAQNVEHRYLSADDMLIDLEEFRKDPSVTFDYSPEDLMEPELSTAHTRVIGLGDPAIEDARERSDLQRNKQARRRTAQEERGSFAAPIAVIAIIVFLVGIGAFLWMSFFSDIFTPSVAEYEVPNVTNMTLSEIAELPDVDSGVFTIVQSSTAASDTVELGEVISQTPSAGTVVKGSSFTISVVVSAGENTIFMPDVLNVELRDAMATLKSMDISWESPEYEYSDDVTRNYIVSTYPVAETELQPGETIQMVVSLGPEPEMVMVVPFVGQYIEDVETQVEKNGLTMGQAIPITSDEEAGRVVWQSIEASQEVEKGTTISFQYSRGPEEEAEPVPEDTTVVPPTESPEVTVTPDVAPSDETTTETEPETQEPSTPTVGQQEPVVSSQSISITLPDGDDNDLVTVRIEIAGVKVYESDVSRKLSPISPFVQGSGTQQVDIYIDGVLTESRTVTFS